MRSAIPLSRMRMGAVFFCARIVVRPAGRKLETED
jgi:hypothetical protein